MILKCKNLQFHQTQSGLPLSQGRQSLQRLVPSLRLIQGLKVLQTIRLNLLIPKGNREKCLVNQMTWKEQKPLLVVVSWCKTVAPRLCRSVHVWRVVGAIHYHHGLWPYITREPVNVFTLTWCNEKAFVSLREMNQAEFPAMHANLQHLKCP